MKKYSPLIHNDSEIYLAQEQEVQFTLNARKLFDRDFGARFNEYAVQALNASVGFFHHTADVSVGDDSILERFFFCLNKSGVINGYAVPTGYCYALENEKSMEVLEYDPPLIGKIKPTFHEFSKIRGGSIGIYSGRHYVFSDCLGYALLDVNGYYSLILGPRIFVQEVLGVSVEESWASIWLDGVVDSSVIEEIRAAAAAYGYR